MCKIFSKSKILYSNHWKKDLLWKKDYIPIWRLISLLSLYSVHQRNYQVSLHPEHKTMQWLEKGKGGKFRQLGRVSIRLKDCRIFLWVCAALQGVPKTPTIKWHRQQWSKDATIDWLKERKAYKQPLWRLNIPFLLFARFTPTRNGSIRGTPGFMFWKVRLFSNFFGGQSTNWKDLPNVKVNRNIVFPSREVCFPMVWIKDLTLKICNALCV